MNKKKIIIMSFSILYYIYYLSVGIFFLYFNYLYAVQHGFLRWILFGEIIATLKAIVWPIFIFL